MVDAFCREDIVIITDPKRCGLGLGPKCCMFLGRDMATLDFVCLRGTKHEGATVKIMGKRSRPTATSFPECQGSITA
jgi:hypothetical protein